MKTNNIILPEIVSREAWREERKELLKEEKKLTRQRDKLNAKRRRLPMVEIEKDYIFEGPEGEVSLLDLFDGRRQLIVYHFMFDPEWDEGCSSCTAGTEELSPGWLDHLHARDTSYALISSAPLEKLEAWKADQGWKHLRWYSSFGSSFNQDFGVTVDPSDDTDTYNYRTMAEYEAMGQGFEDNGLSECPGRSCFLQDDGRVFHTYSQYARGLESTGGSYYFLDLTALGRQEEWEEPKDRVVNKRGANPDFAE